VIVTILATIGVLGVLILVHELGHFLAARAFDIQVTRFSIGLGPRLFGFRRGETDFRVSAIPLGGYVKLAGMKEMEALEGGAESDVVIDPARTFDAKPASVRAVVLAAGVTMNALLAVVLFASIAMIWGRPSPSEPVVGAVVEGWLPEGTHAIADIPRGTRITAVGGEPVSSMDDVARALMAAHAGELTIELADARPVTITIPERARDRQFLPVAIDPVSDALALIGRVAANGPAAEAGLLPGDRVLSVDGRPMATWQELVHVVRQSPGQPLALEIERDGRTIATTVTPTTRHLGDRELGVLGAGLEFREAANVARDRLGPIAAMGYGLDQSRDLVALMGSFFVGLFDGRHSAREMGGPVMIAQFSGAASRAGLPTLLLFTALLSINLAVINLLPIPLLDGGHLMMLGVEAVRGRPPSPRAQAALGRVGLAFVLGLMVWAVTADILRLLGL
jgi:regulator of sigma E protease